MINRWSAASVGLFLAALTVVTAQQPTFKTRADVVLVDFIVSDKANHPVRGLTEKDFVVKEDGKERPIVSFTAYDGEDAVPGVAATRIDPTLPTRAAAALPATVLLIDDGHLSPQQATWLRPALKSLLTSTAGQRGGAVSLVAPWSKVSVAGMLPADAAAFNEGIDRIVGQRFEDRSNLPISDAEAFAVEGHDSGTISRLVSRFIALNPTLQAQEAEAYARTRGAEIAHDARTRRNVLYGIVMLSMDWLAPKPGRHSVIIVSPGFARENADPRYQEIVTCSMRLNAPIHFVDVRGLQGVGFSGVAYRQALSKEADSSPFAWSDAAEGATTLAADTGGLAVGNNNDVEKGLSRVMESISTYYIIGYEAPPHDKPGFKKISVDVKTRGLSVRARRGYVVTQP